MSLPVRRTIAAENIRHFELRTLHRPAGSEILRRSGLGFSGHRLREQIQGAGGRTDLVGGDAQVTGCRSLATTARYYAQTVDMCSECSKSLISKARALVNST